MKAFLTTDGHRFLNNKVTKARRRNRTRNARIFTDYKLRTDASGRHGLFFYFMFPGHMTGSGNDAMLAVGWSCKLAGYEKLLAK